jgi:aryl-alcohol dehydrogenase-like predicted oxidoreductase
VWRTRSLNERNHAVVGVVLEEARQLNASPIAVALAWNLARPGVVAPIIGPKTVTQLNDNLAALDVDLPAEAIERIDAASEPYLPYPHDFTRMARQLTAMMVQQNAPARQPAAPS